MFLKEYFNLKLPKFYNFPRKIKWSDFARHISVFYRYYTRKALVAKTDLPFLLRLLNLNSQGAEVGVWKGDFSAHILAKSKLRVLYSIDPWIHFSANVYLDITNVSQIEFENVYLEAKRKLAKFGKRSKIVKMKSEDASLIFQDNSLDFIYIDANHSYNECRRDLDFYYPKLKKGGIFAGDDYLNEVISDTKFEVKQAVDDFLTIHKHKLFVIRAQYPSWYFIK